MVESLVLDVLGKNHPMQRLYYSLLLVPLIGFSFALSAQDPASEPTPATEESAVTSTLIETPEGGLVLSQTFIVDVPVKNVWDAYVTEEGWTSWSSPHAKIDLRPGGTIRAHYGEDATVGDPGTIILHIVNYVPERVLTLRAEMADHFPDIMKEDDGNLMEVTLFEPLGEARTRVTSYGVGYRDEPEYRQLIEFFTPANEGLYVKLKETLERGAR
jgi:uncharacterized protein YndB with AHSA1/START domain